MIGTTVSRYEILSKLGEGGSGTVYLARDVELDRHVALKFLPQRLVSDAEALERFRRQARAVAALDHPNIITVYEIGSHDGAPFIAMEYVKGHTLADLIRKQRIAPDTALDIAIQLCEGLSAAHKDGIFFRDIRPDSILVGHGGRVRIADFGQTVGEVSSPSISNETRTLLTSARTRAREGDDLADVRSVAGLLREMDTEELFDVIVSRAMSQGREQGYPSVEALADDLAETRLLRFGDAPRRSFAQRALKPLMALILVVVAAVALFVVWKPFERATVAPGEAERRIVAVLPFENLGSADDEYFADGITDEITSRLALVQKLGVISRTSARAYKGTQKSVREIGEELETDYVLEGTIRWDRSRGRGRVRITPQLIRVADDTHVWSNTYEREITEIFSVQGEIASEISTALDVTLHADERQALSTQPTDDFDAYQAYLQGMKQLNTPGFSREAFELGIEMFERAVALDPEFALAYARLSSIHSRMIHHGFDFSESRRLSAKGAVDRALDLQPDLAEAHLALGHYHYWVNRDYHSALAALNTAREKAPNSSEVRLTTAWVKRRQGDLEAAAALLEREIDLSPRDPNATVPLGETYGTLRRYAAAERALRRSIALAPDDVYPYTELALLYLRWRGDTAAARATLQELPATEHTEACRVGYLVELLDREYDAALERLDACPHPVIQAGAFYIPVSLFEALTLALKGEPGLAREAFERSRVALDEKLAGDPGDHRALKALGITYAGLGRSAEAVRHGRQAVEMYPMSLDALQAPVYRIDLALIHTMVDEPSQALEQLDAVLSIPSILSVAWLETDPLWDPLRKHPGFTELLDKHRGQ